MEELDAGVPDDQKKKEKKPSNLLQQPLHSQVGNVFNRLLQNKNLVDVTFAVGPGRKLLQAHRLLLAARSPVFAAMFHAGFAESTSTDTIPLPDVTFDAFSVLLQYIYTDRVALTPENLVECLFAAKKFQVSGLLSACKRLLWACLNPSNCCSFLNSAPPWMDEASVILSFIHDHASDVLNSDEFRLLPLCDVDTIIGSEGLELEEHEIFKALLGWARAQCDRQGTPTSYADIARVLPRSSLILIRFPLMSASELATLVAPTELLTTNELNDLFRYSALMEDALDVSKGGAFEPMLAGVSADKESTAEGLVEGEQHAPDTNTERESNPETENTIETEPNTEIEAPRETEAKTERESKTEKEAKTERESKTEKEAKTERESKTDREAETEGEAKTEREFKGGGHDVEGDAGGGRVEEGKEEGKSGVDDDSGCSDGPAVAGKLTKTQVRAMFDLPYSHAPRGKGLQRPGRLSDFSGRTPISTHRMGRTQNCLCQDPMTGRVYFFENYMTSTEVVEWPSLDCYAQHPTTAQHLRARPFRLARARIGTYHCVAGGFLYYRADPGSGRTLIKARVQDGSVVCVNEDTLANALVNSTASFSWGGSSDVGLYVGRGGKLYCMYQSRATASIAIAELRTTDLSVKRLWHVPRTKPSCGFAFLCAGVFYFGTSYSSPVINGAFTLCKDSYDSTFHGALPRGTYISQVQWNPRSNCLFINDNSQQLVYENASR